MRKVLVASVLALLLIGLFARGASAGEGSIWIYGDVMEVPTGVDYGGAYYQFNFSIGQTNSLLMTSLPRNITVVIPVVLMSILVFNNLTQTLGQGLNFTGEVVEDQPNLQSIPVGYFAVSRINGDQSEAPAWVQSLKTLWNAVSGIGKMVVTLIVQIIGSTAGFIVPEWVIALAVISFTLVVFAKWFKSLPWILVVIGFFVCAAILSSLIQGLMW